MAKITARCCICEGPITMENGFYVCDTHGVMPYDWAVGTITRDKALDAMEKWGADTSQARKKIKKARAVEPNEDDERSAPKGGAIADLINQLKLAMNPADKRRLRQALRKAGHVGGLKK
jgi:hypothetical protein